jgi:hypothetical protein
LDEIIKDETRDRYKWIVPCGKALEKIHEWDIVFKSKVWWYWMIQRLQI